VRFAPVKIVGRTVETPSFISLLEIHKDLKELFLEHQEALLDGDLIQAEHRLEEFERALLDHMQKEEDLLFPVYERAGAIPGGPPVLFTGEHKRMRELLGGFKRALSSLEQNPDGRKRGILWLLDRQATFKNLMEHHDLREANILYPALDRVTTMAERRDILARCGVNRG
jgi:hemerythrin-like domain-containing protein